MRVSKAKADENRERILKEAARLIRERGIAGVGVDALTEAAGLTHGSLYSQFGSKERLAAEALSYALAALGSDMPRQSEFLRGRFTEGLRHIVERLTELMRSIPARRREEEALAVIATLVGALVLARAVDDAELSDRILRASRARLTTE